MRTVHEYELSMTEDIQTFNMPKSNNILKFGEQEGKVMMWVDIRTECDIETLIKLQIIGTGHDIGDYPAVYLDTVQMSNGLVWHIYERF